MRWNQLGKNSFLQNFQGFFGFFFLLRTHSNEQLRTLSLKCQNVLFQAAVIHFDLLPVSHRNQNNMF